MRFPLHLQKVHIASLLPIRVLGILQNSKTSTLYLQQLELVLGAG